MLSAAGVSSYRIAHILDLVSSMCRRQHMMNHISRGRVVSADVGREKKHGGM